MNKKLEAVVLDYIKSGVIAVVPLYLSGVTNPKALMNAFAVAVLGPIYQGLSKKNIAYGRGCTDTAHKG